MGRMASIYTLIGVEITMPELRAWLVMNRKNYDDSKYGSSKGEEYAIASEYAPIYESSKSRIKPFSSINYDEGLVNNVYIGYAVIDDWISIGCDGCQSIGSIDLKKAIKKIDKLKNLYPKKKVEIISIMDLE